MTKNTPLKLFNSATKKKERFSVIKEPIGVYVCGITPDARPHLGHAFTYTMFDVLVRYLRSLGHEVTYVQNLTDIDDDLLARAEKARKHWRAFAQENAQAFLEDLQWLSITPPSLYPRATDHIPSMHEIIKRLLKNGLAYERGGSVYFSVSRHKEFGSLSKIAKKEMLPLANQRGNNPEDPNKDNPLDFVLWQKKKPGEPSWPSPWGKGRPGWHIECSAMSMKYLGKTLDIHGGGGDLVFPHHECSKAQSECATGKQFVRFWMHTGMVRYQGEKMSKSLGNLVFPSELKKSFSANEVKLCLLSHHYRGAWEFDDKERRIGRERSELFKKVWRAQSGMGSPLSVLSFHHAFFEAMNDDLNTPKALLVLERLAKRILKERHRDVSVAKAFLQEAFSIFGLRVEFI